MSDALHSVTRYAMYQSGWTTKDELLFIRGLGRGEFRLLPPNVPLADRKTLLRRYLASMPLRADWGQIDSVRVRQEVEMLLRMLPDERRGR